jgi:formylglycine-generating enzyme required for sulfatase activity
VIVPAGTYRIGSTRGRADEWPEHDFTVSSFEIDEFPVTVDQVYEVLKSNGDPLPHAWVNSPPSRTSVPAVNLSYREANHIAQLMRKRLPTEEEFEIAAGSIRGSMYAHSRPGAGPLPLMTSNEAIEKGLFSPNGLTGVVGMIYSWTSSDYNWYPKRNDMRIMLPSVYKVVRGGIWSLYDARISFRSFRDPNRGYSRVGLRCVHDIKNRR